MAATVFSLDGETPGNGGEAGGAPGGAGDAIAGGGGANATGGNTGGGTDSGIGDAIPAKKRRGRQPLPRDAAGNIIRPAADPDAASNKGRKAGLGVGFVKNDRAVVLNNIQAIHTGVALLAKQPVFMLSPQEATALTSSLCDVLDYHHINICGAGGPYGLYAALLITAVSIYKPRLDVVSGRATIVGVSSPTAPATPNEADARAAEQPKTGMMDFSGAA